MQEIFVGVAAEGGGPYDILYLAVEDEFGGA